MRITSWVVIWWLIFFLSDPDVLLPDEGLDLLFVEDVLRQPSPPVGCAVAHGGEVAV